MFRKVVELFLLLVVVPEAEGGGGAANVVVVVLVVVVMAGGCTKFAIPIETKADAANGSKDKASQTVRGTAAAASLEGEPKNVAARCSCSCNSSSSSKGSVAGSWPVAVRTNVMMRIVMINSSSCSCC